MNTSTLVLRAAAVRAYESAKTLLAMVGLAALAAALFLPLQRDSLVKTLPSLDGDAIPRRRSIRGGPASDPGRDGGRIALQPCGGEPGGRQGSDAGDAQVPSR